MLETCLENSNVGKMKYYERFFYINKILIEHLRNLAKDSFWVSKIQHVAHKKT